MPEIIIKIDDCRHCIFKTEYIGIPDDYWVCDGANKTIENLDSLPDWCPLIKCNMGKSNEY